MQDGGDIGTGRGGLSAPVRSPCRQDSKKDNLCEKVKEFMRKYDKNADGKIEMAEVSGAGPADPRDGVLACPPQPLTLVFPAAGPDPAHGGEFLAVLPPARGLQLRVHGGERGGGLPTGFGPRRSALLRRNNPELHCPKPPKLPQIVGVGRWGEASRCGWCWFGGGEQERSNFSQCSALLGQLSGRPGASSRSPREGSRGDLELFLQIPPPGRPVRDVPQQTTLLWGSPKPRRAPGEG